MNRHVRILVVMLALALTVGLSLASAQEAELFNVPFAFRMGAKILQPGTYEVRVNEDLMGITITPTRGAAVLAASMTRLAEPEPPLEQGKAVFDKVGDVYYLSEVWIPGYDGFLVHSTKEAHTHVKVKMDKKAER